jgi:hypothetical protein
VLVQSPRPGLSVDVRGLDDRPLGADVTNVSDYTDLFGFEEERRIYHRSADVSSTAWLFAVLSVAVAVTTWVVNGLLWFRAELVLATIAEEMLDKERFVIGTAAKDGFSIYMSIDERGESTTYVELLNEEKGSASKPELAYVVAAKILFTATDCYERYPGLIEHVRGSLR